MLQRWHHSPWWVVSLASGALFALLIGIFLWITERGSLAGTAAGAVVGGTFFGAFMGPVLTRTRPRWDAVPASVSPTQHRAGVRAARSGAVPADPASREIAVEVARTRLAHARRWRTLELSGFGAFIALYVVMALVSSPWWWFAALLFATLFVMAALQSPARLSRRLDGLAAAD